MPVSVVRRLRNTLGKEPLIHTRPGMTLQRHGPDTRGGVAICSLPLPAVTGAETGLAGSVAGEPTSLPTVTRQLSAGTATADPRYLLCGLLDGDAPEQLTLDAAGAAGPGDDSSLAAWSHGKSVVEELYLNELYRCTEQVDLGWGDGTVGIRVGVIAEGHLQWWQWPRVEVVRETPLMTELCVGGYAATHLFTSDDEIIPPGGRVTDSPWLHVHCWLYCQVHVRLFANGVADFCVRHINNRMFNDGEDLEDVVAVIGLQLPGQNSPAVAQSWAEPWDGARHEFPFTGGTLDLGAAAHLVSPEEPGGFEVSDELLVWQPYSGPIYFAGQSWAPSPMTPERLLCRSSDKLWPRGMARTVSFQLSLSERPARVVRYLPPACAFGLSGEWYGDALLPVTRTDEDIAAPHLQRLAASWLSEGVCQGSFMAGEAARHRHEEDGVSHWCPSGEGEVGYSLILEGLRTGNDLTYRRGLWNAYHMADVYVDHAAGVIRLTGVGFGKVALPHERVHAILHGYLETGDPYLLEVAEMVLDHAYWWDRRNWPRHAIGRDSAYVRGLILLYQITGNAHWLERARETLHRVAQTQLADGSFNDQGCTVALAGQGNIVVKPWMAGIVVDVCFDFVKAAPGDEIVEGIIRRGLDWLVASAIPREGGGVGWKYEASRVGIPCEGGAKHIWIAFYLLAPLFEMACRTGDRRYTDTLAESIAGDWSEYPDAWCDQGANKVLQNMHRVATWTLRPRWDEDTRRVYISPEPLALPDDDVSSTWEIATPDGPVQVELSRSADGFRVRGSGDKVEVRIEAVGK